MRAWELIFLLLRILSGFCHSIEAERIPLHRGPVIENHGRKLHGKFLHITGK